MRRRRRCDASAGGRQQIRNPKSEIMQAGVIPNSSFLIPNSGGPSRRPICYLCFALHGVGISDRDFSVI